MGSGMLWRGVEAGMGRGAQSVCSKAAIFQVLLMGDEPGSGGYSGEVRKPRVQKGMSRAAGAREENEWWGGRRPAAINSLLPSGTG